MESTYNTCKYNKDHSYCINKKVTSEFTVNTTDDESVMKILIILPQT